MTKSSKYVCQQCGYESVGWLGKCPNCGEWNSLVETVLENSKTPKLKNSKQTQNIKIQKLADIKTSQIKRILTKVPELDRVLGGGLVPGQAILIAGEPGIGKSTLLLQAAASLATSHQSPATVLYVCGEESPFQVAIRSQRLGVKSNNIELLENTDVDEVISLVTSHPALPAGRQSPVTVIVVDSIQTMTTTDLAGMAGSVGQVRECAFRLIQACKAKNIPLFLVGHVTKEGTVAGPAVLAHLVDTVLWFEGDKTLAVRVLRAVKNRFGPTDEVGLFEMGEQGLSSVTNGEKFFLEKKQKDVSGSVVTPVMQGTRPLLVEIQALVVPTKLAIPRRVAQGIDSRRLELLLAVLTRRCGLPLYEHDVFVNVAGGLKVTEPASDLAICLSVAGSYFNKPLSRRLVAVGEVGLLGEIREVSFQEKRINEARRLGFAPIISSQDFLSLSQTIKKLF